MNSWNGNRQFQYEIRGIYSQIVYGLDNDIAELSGNLNYYESIEPIFDKVISDSRTKEMLDDGLSRIISRRIETVLNKSGVERLKTISANDSLSLKVIQIYKLLEYFNTKEKTISDQQELLQINYRDNYSWYSEWISKRITKDNSSPELQDYFVNSKEYRHDVIYMYNQIYNNYMRTLKIRIPQLKQIKNEMQNAIN